MALTKAKKARLRMAKGRAKSVREAIGDKLSVRSRSADVQEIGTTFKGSRIMNNIRPLKITERPKHFGPSIIDGGKTPSKQYGRAPLRVRRVWNANADTPHGGIAFEYELK